MTDLTQDTASCRVAPALMRDTTKARDELIKQIDTMLRRMEIDPAVRFSMELQTMLERTTWLGRLAGLAAATVGDQVLFEKAMAVMDAQRTIRDELDRRLEAGVSRMIEVVV